MKIGKARSVARMWGMLVCMVVSAATCGPPEQEQEEVEAGMEGMSHEREQRSEMAGGEQTLHEHMQQMSLVPPDSLVHVMPMHLQKVGEMLEEMDPTAMGMQADTVWRATLDSVQNDLAQMRDMPPAELREIMPDHTRRMQRLISRHDSAMGSSR